MDGNAIVITNGILHTSRAKTAHGLIRGSTRYNIVGILDHVNHGSDAGEMVDGKKREIPVYKDLDTFLAISKEKAQYFIIGVGFPGGNMPQELLPVLQKAIRSGMSLVSGLHEYLSDKPELADLALEMGTQIIDIRKPKPRNELHFWSGDIRNVAAKKIAVLGTDIIAGKRTSMHFLCETAREMGLKAEMVYTGQTGWMQGIQHGFIFDATLNDFVSGELEHAIVSCDKELKPDVIFIEGQAALRNPSGPCGAEFLISCDLDGVVLQHVEGRQYYRVDESLKIPIPPLQSEIDLIRAYGKEVVGVSLNTEGLSVEEAKAAKERHEQELGIPVVLPIEEGQTSFGEIVERIME